MKNYLKTPIRRHLAGWAVAATLAVTLAACGGGGGDQAGSTVSPATVPPPLAASVPASAVVDVPAFVSYLNTLATNDAQEPLLTDAVTPPTNESGEPISI